ncbi:histone-lysine N-methyltransferase SMYD3-like isoform X2 [Artemia franciscana]|uniref:MYND-type domain-containing protein n=1 Tax=Artemia franciscana TaxID=6661 RepID=A0AA88HDW0_ARTSF|nr:hypothetical protein QYM36_014966 [Artemia franciscana]
MPSICPYSQGRISPTKVFRCSGCKYIYYCDRSCQGQAWKTHKDECPCLKQVQPCEVSDTVRLLGRILFKFKRNGEMEDSCISNTRSRRFKDLMSHYKDLKNNPDRMIHFVATYKMLKKFIGTDMSLPNESDLLGIYGRVSVNSFNIVDIEYRTLGVGLYLAASIFDHSCTPNAVPVFNGISLKIIALEDIECIDKVFISYIDVMNLTAERRKQLKYKYFFDCMCEKCTDPNSDKVMSSLKCSTPNCDAPIFADFATNTIQPCDKCGYQYESKVLQSYHEAAEYTTVNLDNMKDVNYLDACRLCLIKQGGLFHSLNILRSKILDAAFESCIDLSLWDDAPIYGEELVISFREYYGQNHPLLGMLLAKLGKIKFNEGKDVEAAVFLKEALEILSLTHKEHKDFFSQVKELSYHASMLKRHAQ